MPTTLNSQFQTVAVHGYKQARRIISSNQSLKQNVGVTELRSHLPTLSHSDLQYLANIYNNATHTHYKDYLTEVKLIKGIEDRWLQVDLAIICMFGLSFSTLNPISDPMFDGGYRGEKSLHDLRIATTTMERALKNKQADDKMNAPKPKPKASTILHQKQATDSVEIKLIETGQGEIIDADWVDEIAVSFNGKMIYIKIRDSGFDLQSAHPFSAQHIGPEYGPGHNVIVSMK